MAPKKDGNDFDDDTEVSGLNDFGEPSEPGEHGVFADRIPTAVGHKSPIRHDDDDFADRMPTLVVGHERPILQLDEPFSDVDGGLPDDFEDEITSVPLGSDD